MRHHVGTQGRRFRLSEILHKGNVSFILDFVKWKQQSAPTTRISSKSPLAGRPANEIERTLAEGLRKQRAVQGLPGIAIENVRIQPEPPFDITFQLRSGRQRIPVFVESKPDFSPRRLAEIAPWIGRLKSLRQGVSIAVAAPVLSPQSQAFCIENGIDFLDLAGNVFINVPGKFTIQRIGMRDRSIKPSTPAVPVMNVFSGRASRVLRVLLEKPREWSVKGIADELARESERLAKEVPQWQFDLRISMGTVSKAVASLEEQLWIRRLGARIVVPEPARLLRQWAEKYRERYRWRLRGAAQVANPFGADIGAIAAALRPSVSTPFAASGAAAVADVAPWVEADIIDFFTPSVPNAKSLQLPEPASARRERELETTPLTGGGPLLRFIVPYDPGVFMYCRRNGAALLVSLVQAYLDLFARGGRDWKQADHLLEQSIAPRWSAV